MTVKGTCTVNSESCGVASLRIYPLFSGYYLFSAIFIVLLVVCTQLEYEKCLVVCLILKKILYFLNVPISFSTKSVICQSINSLWKPHTNYRLNKLDTVGGLVIKQQIHRMYFTYLN